jgi:hypothetical protein
MAAPVLQARVEEHLLAAVVVLELLAKTVEAMTLVALVVLVYQIQLPERQ